MVYSASMRAPLMSEPREVLVCCYLCHRYRKPDKLVGGRCEDRGSCFQAVARPAPQRLNPGPLEHREATR